MPQLTADTYPVFSIVNDIFQFVRQGKNHIRDLSSFLIYSIHPDHLKRIIQIMGPDLAFQGVQLGLLLLDLGHIRLINIDLKPLDHPVEPVGEPAHLIIRVHRQLSIQLAGLHYGHLLD
ncbi:hypothetical protein D3C75_756420 [compost metagenome]